MTIDMNDTDYSSPDSAGWDQFIHFARLFHDADTFDSQERDYKLVVAQNLRDTQRSLMAGERDWPLLLKKAFGPPNNLTNWRIHAPFIKWCQGESEAAASALRIIWDSSKPLASRFDAFIAAVPRDVAKVSIAEASFLNMALDYFAYPVYRPTPVLKAMKLTDYPPFQDSGQPSAGARYEYYLEFLNRVMAEAEQRDFHLRDRLDAQSVVWSVTQWQTGDDWGAHEREALRVFLSGEVGEVGDTSLPDVTREQLIGAMEVFDLKERSSVEWEKWPDFGNHKWAIAEDSRLYPVKHVISSATGLPVSAFSGGEQANQYVQQRGLQVVSLTQPTTMPTYAPPTFSAIVDGIS